MAWGLKSMVASVKGGRVFVVETNSARAVQKRAAADVIALAACGRQST